MSYAAQRKLSSRATMFYPNVIKVYEFDNPMTGEKQPVFDKTTPYSKSLQGETKDDIRRYLAHMVDNYQKNRDTYIKSELAKLEKG